MFKEIFIYIALSLSTLFGTIFHTDTVKTTTINATPSASVSANLAPVEQAKIKENRLERLSQSKGLQDADKTDKYIEEQVSVTKDTNQISNYQAYVTPDDSVVNARSKGKSTTEIYQDSLTWVWVEDNILNGVSEKWLLPNVFLSQTPNMSTNPVPGKIASDCEEHAYTLASMLRASGISADNVRVVTGKVNFSGSTGGHVWVEMYDSDKRGWFQLEPSSGDNYNSETKQLIDSDGLPYDYFKSHQYPVIEVWTYFNDKYFWDNNRQQGIRPTTWENGIIEKSASSEEIKYQLPKAVQQYRENSIEKFQKENQPQLPTPTGALTSPPFQNNNFRQQLATPSGAINPQPTLSIQQSIFAKLAQAFIYLQQSNRQEDLTGLVDQIISDVNNSQFSDTQKQSIIDIANKIKNTYSTAITQDALIQLRQEIISVITDKQEQKQTQLTPFPKNNPRSRNRL
jgi:hypothetical protein